MSGRFRGGQPAAPAPKVTPGALVRPSAWSATFTSLKEREFAWYLAGNIAFFLGMQMQFVLRGFLAYDLTGTASSLGLIALSVAAPMLVVAPIGGVVADRVNKRTLLIVTQASAAVASLVLAVLIIGGWVEFWHLIATSLATGIIFSFNMPARQALVPNLVPQHKLMNAVSLQMGGMNLTRIIGPALGGGLIAPFGIGWVYLLTFFLFALASASEFHLPRHGMTGEGERRRFDQDLLFGFQYILRDPRIRLLMLAALLMPLFAFPLQQLFPVFQKDVFGLGPWALGALAAMSGFGGLVGAIVSANMDRQPRKGFLMFLGGLAMGVFMLAFALTPSFYLALVFLAASAVGQMVFMATNNTAIQMSLSPDVRGRVMSVLMMSFGLMPLGVIPVTIAADAYGARVAIAGLSVVLFVMLFAMFGASRQLRRMRMEAAAEAELSAVRAATLVAEGKMTQEEADRILGRGRAPRPGSVPAGDRPP